MLPTGLTPVDDDTMFPTGPYNIAQGVAWCIHADAYGTFDMRIDQVIDPRSFLQLYEGDE